MISVEKSRIFAAKMIYRHRHIIVTLLITNLLISNVGLSVNWLYCYCKGQMQVSLFTLDDKCKDEAKKEDTNCCKSTHCDTSLSREETDRGCDNSMQQEKELKPCCQKFSKYKKTTEKPCTKKGIKYVKADLKFLSQDKETKPLQFIDFEAIRSVSFVQNLPYFFSEKILSTQSNKAPPPRIYGRALLEFVQNYRI